MIVGVIVGTYSSIYIASPLLLIFGEGTAQRPRARSPAADYRGDGGVITSFSGGSQSLRWFCEPLLKHSPIKSPYHPAQPCRAGW